MLPSLADLDALGERLGVAFTLPLSLDGIRAQAALDDASALIRVEAGKSFVDELDVLLPDLPDVIRAVTLSVAYRAFRNPDGTTQSSLGDVSVSFAREGAAGAIFLTQEERRAIRKAAGRNMFSSLGMQTPYLINAGDINRLVPGSSPDSDPFPLGPFPWET